MLSAWTNERLMQLAAGGTMALVLLLLFSPIRGGAIPISPILIVFDLKIGRGGSRIRILAN